MTAEKFHTAAEKSAPQADGGVMHWLNETVVHPAINGSGLLQVYDTLAGKPADTLSQTKAKTGSADWMVETLASAAGAIVPYVLAGKFAGNFIGNRAAAQIIGAGAYTALEAPTQGQTRFGNAVGTMAAFGVFEGGNTLLGKLDGSIGNRFVAGTVKGLGRIGVGAAGGLVSYETTNLGSSLTGAKNVDYSWDGAWKSMASGGFMNFALPVVQHGTGVALGKATEAIHSFGSKPAETAPALGWSEAVRPASYVTGKPSGLAAETGGLQVDSSKPVDANLFTIPHESIEHPLGADVTENGTNFALRAPDATAADLLIYSHPDDTTAIASIPMTNANGTWSAFVPEAKDGTLYNFRVHGPYDPKQGDRFNAIKVLNDPYARALTEDKRTSGITNLGYDDTNPNDPNRHLFPSTVDDSATMPKSVAVKLGKYNWGNDRLLGTPLKDSIIYEANLRGFTATAPDVPAAERGTYLGAARKMGYLKDLGVTAVEWQPLQKFDHADQKIDPATGKTLENAWGYNTMNFFAPDEKFAADKTPGQQITEFKDMVKAAHDKGIEVIMDVVYNHTAEGNQFGPTFSFKGLDNKNFYLLAPGQPDLYQDHTGVGNTVNASNPDAQKLIVDSLKYWVQEMHVDGFRFDLADIFHRGTDGQLHDKTPILEAIAADPVLSKVKLIAEPWSISSYYSGHYYPEHWAEWSDKFRDTARKFVKGDAGVTSSLADVVAGQPGSFDRSQGRYPINYFASHDGFTLNDLVSYNWKHNDANGEQNRDGTDNNLSWNGGYEGPVDNAPLTDQQKADIQNLRNRQAKNFMALLHVSQGPPMFLMGDEALRTTGGNNNPYNQLSLNNFDWSLLQKNQGMHEFTKGMIDLRKTYHIGDMGPDAITWHGTEPNQPDFSDSSRTLAWEYKPATPDGKRLYMAFNAYWNPVKFDLPNGNWHRLVDTNLAPGQDIVQSKDAPEVSGGSYWLAPRSAIILEAPANGNASAPANIAATQAEATNVTAAEKRP